MRLVVELKQHHGIGRIRGCDQVPKGSSPGLVSHHAVGHSAATPAAIHDKSAVGTGLMLVDNYSHALGVQCDDFQYIRSLSLKKTLLTLLVNRSTISAIMDRYPADPNSLHSESYK